MFQFTYARNTQTGPITAVVIALHALALSALFWTLNAPDIENQRSIAMEMVLAPMQDPTPKPVPVRNDPKPTVTKTAAPSAPSTAPTPAPSPAPQATSDSTPAAAPTNTARANSAPAFSLPSSEAQGLNNPKPAYPRLSRRLNEQGQVVIRVLVGADGLPQQADIKTSSGFDRLDQEALRTVQRWRFVPGQRAGVAEAMWFNVPVNFVLE